MRAAQIFERIHTEIIAEVTASALLRAEITTLLSPEGVLLALTTKPIRPALTRSGARRQPCNEDYVRLVDGVAQGEFR